MTLAPAISKLDQAIRADGEALSLVSTLLLEKSDLFAWPRVARIALATALGTPEGSDAFERDKADRLRRHLFVDMPTPDALLGSGEPGPFVERIADRLRADLSDLTPFGAGLHLVDYDKALDAWIIKAR
jgi:hypothetical protein